MYLTGKAGNAWISPHMSQAYRYGGDGFAQLAVIAMASNTTDERMRGFRFNAVPYNLPDPVDELALCVDITDPVPAQPAHIKTACTYTLEDVEDGATLVVMYDGVTNEEVAFILSGCVLVADFQSLMASCNILEKGA
jgi:hypothetical protein